MKPPIALMTDFGATDTYVGVMKGVIHGIASEAPVYDLTHGIPAGDIRQAAFKLWQAVPYFPQKTVFIVVVDPGVGTKRRPIAARWEHWRLILPDNGLLTYLQMKSPLVEVHELANSQYQLDDVSTTFHGRDIFAPAGAHVWRGVPLADFGPLVKKPLTFEPPNLKVLEDGWIAGEIVHVDKFGNLITSIGRLKQRQATMTLDPWLYDETPFEFPAENLSVLLADERQITLRTTFGEVQEGDPLCYVGSEHLLEIAINQGSAANRLGLSIGDEIRFGARST